MGVGGLPGVTDTAEPEEIMLAMAVNSAALPVSITQVFLSIPPGQAVGVVGS
ncbi:hypothetical protein GCM10011610_62100 [Nocardia rhizosphaerihabitans]|uniref:Uncharacterized protein n=1 Tax=Nocardia rhizosphaerihabitans TaxID=1691570 RepID=A0ABQ2KY58_9NOCA|nr:hypothetical protein GCM10011610_62100 [Nocardia rhizosphaerihabitans]